MARLVLLGLTAMVLSSGHVRAAVLADFFVSTKGNDAWSGRLADPSPGGKDGPFASVSRAQTAVRSLKAAEPGRSTPFIVRIRSGVYYLPKPLLFAPEDSGTPRAPVIYASYPGEQPVLSGGVPVKGFRPSPGGTWTALLPEARGGKWAFTQMWADGSRRYRPRLPRSGYYTLASAVDQPADLKGVGFDRVGFAKGDIRASWHALNDIEFLGFQTWTMARLRLKDIDEEQQIAIFAAPIRSTANFFALGAGSRFLLENIEEAFGQPGDFYLDRASGSLKYKPIPGESLNKTAIIAPRLTHVIELRGDSPTGRSVSNLQFKGLTFAHTNWETPAEGNTFAQAEAAMGAAVRATYARDCSFQRCRILHTGEYGLELGAGCKRNSIIDCLLSDLGAGGIKIGLLSYASDADAIAQSNIVKRCEIAHGGRMHPAGVGVLVGHSPGNLVANNHIWDFYYTGISVGWSWGYGPSNAHDNQILANHIHQIGQGVLSDMGGIYTLGLKPGNILDGNVIHDVDSYAYGGWGIYFDEGTTGAVARNNLVYRCKSASFHQHYGKDNRVTNNILAFGRENQLMRTRAEEHRSFEIDHNIIYFDSGVLLGSNWSGSNYSLHHNLYYNAAGEAVSFTGKTFEEWKEAGQDAGSVIADPLFRAPSSGDFRLKPETPALALGFVPFDYTRAGIPGARPSPAAPRAFPSPAPRKAAALRDSFETASIGAPPAAGTVVEEAPHGTIRVTDQAASRGGRSLKITDARGLAHSYNPHLYYSLQHASGTLQCSFDIMIEPLMTLTHEWRDGASPYRTGPSIRFEGDGWVKASGRRLMQIPFSDWAHIDVRCQLGATASGFYSVRITANQRPVRLFDRIPLAGGFDRANWIGFIASDDLPGVCFLDDLVIAPLKP